VVAVMHMNSPWMLGEEEGLFGDLTGRSSGRRSDGCDRAMMSGSGDDLSSGESELLHKRNQKEGGEWMWWWIMRLPTPFIGRRREGRWYRGGETVDSEWSYSMLSFRKGKGACEEALDSHVEGQPKDAAAR
jgi:hypothetical protein